MGIGRASGGKGLCMVWIQPAGAEGGIDRGTSKGGVRAGDHQ